jgi:O-antigen ligase
MAGTTLTGSSLDSKGAPGAPVDAAARPFILAANQPSALQNLGFVLLVVYNFVLVSRVLEFLFPYGHLPAVLFIGVVAAGLLVGNLRVALSSPICRTVLMLGVWMALTVPFAHVRSQSFNEFTRMSRVFVFFLATSALIGSLEQFVTFFKGIGWALLTSATMTFVVGGMISGRLSMANQGTFSDPNYLSVAMAAGTVPWLFTMASTRSLFMKIFSAGAVVLLLYVFARTGSRTGMICLGGILLVHFLYASAMAKVRILVICVVGAVVATAFLPRYLTARFTTIFDVDASESSDPELRLLGADVASTEGRMALLKDSLIITATHPIFGVGLGNFAEYSDLLAKQAGLKRGDWQPTHNSFTQMSSEAGLPAFLLYCSALILSIRRLLRLRKQAMHSQHPQARLIGQCAYFLFLAIIGMTFGISFLSMAYDQFYYILFAMVIALDYHSQALLRAPPQTAAGIGSPQFPPAADSRFVTAKPRRMSLLQRSLEQRARGL